MLSRRAEVGPGWKECCHGSYLECMPARRRAQRATCHLHDSGAPLPPSNKTRDNRTLEPLLRFACDLDSRTRKELARATVKVASESKQRREQEAVPRKENGREADIAENAFYWTPYHNATPLRNVHSSTTTQNRDRTSQGIYTNLYNRSELLRAESSCEC